MPEDVHGAQEHGGEAAFVHVPFKFVDHPDGGELADDEYGDEIAGVIDGFLREGSAGGGGGGHPEGHHDEGEDVGENPEVDFGAIGQHEGVLGGDEDAEFLEHGGRV